MSFLKKLLALSMGVASLGGAYAKLDLSSSSNVVVYWGQNSLGQTGDLAQQRLGYYCDDSNIDVIVLAFLTTINGQGGAPEVDFANAGDKCTTIPGTNLKKCPEIGEGGFQSESAARDGADLVWKTFGPAQSGTAHVNTTVHHNTTYRPIHNTIVRRQNQIRRPFGDAVVDGFDFDFEAHVDNMAPFANRLRELSDADTSKQYFLTAAPQCPYPDAADKDILNGPVSIDAVFVQFYNNFCGVGSFVEGQDTQDSFNLETWDDWAKNDSQNKKAKVIVGVPANTGAAGSGYIPVTKLKSVIEYSKTFSSFGGVMLWDVSQAYGNDGFLQGTRQALGSTQSRISSRPYRYHPIRW